MAELENTAAKPSRLKEAGEEPTISPWVRATRLQSASLYWLGVSTWPPMFRNRQWLCAFFDRLVAYAEGEYKVAPMQFLSSAVAGNVLNDPFTRNARNFVPILGATATPGRKPAQAPTPDEIEQATKKKINLDADRFTADYTYWFVRGNHAQQRAMFLGYGGMTLLLAAPDEKAKIVIPEIPKYILDHPSMASFKAVDMQAEAKVAENLNSEFGQKSKDLFGGFLKDEAIFEGLRYVLPAWTSASFFDSKPEDVQNLFKLCKLYIQESPQDKGILLACEDNLDQVIIEIVEQLKTADKMEYTI